MPFLTDLLPPLPLYTVKDGGGAAGGLLVRRTIEEIKVIIFLERFYGNAMDLRGYFNSEVFSSDFLLQML